MQTTKRIAVSASILILLMAMAACAASDDMMDRKMDSKMDQKMDAPMDGMLMGSAGHHASGKASIGMGMGGKSVLTLTGIDVDRVPDGIVYLAKNADHRNGVELGKLEQFTGTVTFDIPADVHADDYDSVVIWCRKFNVEIGRAYLPKKMM